MTDRRQILPPYTVDEAAEWLGLHPHTIRRRIDAGEIAVFRVGRSIRITAAEMDRLTAGGGPTTRP